MKKIPSLFMRNYDGDRLVRDEIVPGCEWVVNGEGIATRKWDGTACLVRDGKLFKRYDAKHGKTPPEGFEPSQDPDPVSGHWPGWLPVSSDDPNDRWHRDAFEGFKGDDGTYELIGPKVNGNPERIPVHVLERHGLIAFPWCPLTFVGLRDFLSNVDIEGIVWHHLDGRMAKIKAKDFGIRRRHERSE